MIFVLSCWRCTLWKVFFLASLMNVLVQLPANLRAENFRTVCDSSCPCGPDAVLVALGCVVEPLCAWFDSGYMHCRIWQLTVRCLNCLRNTGIWDFLGDDLVPLVSSSHPAFGVSVWSDSGYTLTRQFRRSSDIFLKFST